MAYRHRDDLVARAVGRVNEHEETCELVRIVGGDVLVRRKHPQRLGQWVGNDSAEDRVDRMGIERMLSLDIAGSATDPLGASVPAERKREIREYLEKNADRVSGLIPVDPSRPVESCRKIEEWVRDGPFIFMEL